MADRKPDCQIEKEIHALECPFNWITNKDDDAEYFLNDDAEYYLNDEEELFPLTHLMQCIMTVYVDTKAKTESDEILKGLEKCDEIMMTLKENNHPEISTDLVYYVLQSTKCFVFRELNLPEKLKQIFSEIKKDWKMNSKERSTLLACRSICWSKYHCEGSSFLANYLIRCAIVENPNCELWHFILGTNLRRYRIKEEMSCFEKAYNMSANPVFGVLLAQMYREMRKINEAENIYNKIFEQNPTETTILLRLALGFIRLQNYSKAKVCLDRVQAVCSKQSMYLYYSGIYHLKHKNYKEDVLQYLHDVLDKHNHLPKKETQPLLLDIALTYWLKNRDVPNAIKYFTMAVEINPEAKCITNFFSSQVVLQTVEKNMYKLLDRDILPIVLKNKEKFEQSCIDEAKELQRHCNEYFAKNVTRTLNSFSKFNLRN